MARLRTIILILVVATAVFFWYMKNSWSNILSGMPGFSTTTNWSGSTATDQNAPASKLPALKADTGGSHPGLSYSQAVRLYVDRHMQFGTDCSASPDSLFIQSGATVMFDNLSTTGRYIGLDGVRYYLRARDFRILELSSPRLPNKVEISCGGKTSGHITLN